MNKRFCRNFLLYLKIKYPGKANYSQYPAALLDRYGKPAKPKHFTLGNVAYVLCYLEDPSLSEEEKHNNRAKLMEYVKERLLSKLSNEEIAEECFNLVLDVEKMLKKCWIHLMNKKNLCLMTIMRVLAR